MINTLESLANEILLNILSYLTWFEMIESFWSINKRFNSLICSIFSINYGGNKSGTIISETDLSLLYNEFILMEQKQFFLILYLNGFFKKIIFVL